MTKFSRRGILAGLMVAGAAPAAAIEIKPEPPKRKFIKGQVLPRVSYQVQPQIPWEANSPSIAMAVVEYEIYDGKHFVPLFSAAGQQVIMELQS